MRLNRLWIGCRIQRYLPQSPWRAPSWPNHVQTIPSRRPKRDRRGRPCLPMPLPMRRVHSRYKARRCLRFGPHSADREQVCALDQQAHLHRCLAMRGAWHAIRPLE